MDAAEVFDEMSPWKKTENAPSATNMDDLQDDVLPTIVSFLPAHEAVRTCVLARRWRHVWTCSPTLRITAVKNFGSARFIQFIDQLLFLRRQGPCPLDSCHFDLVETDFAFDWFMLVERVYLHSIQAALDRNARTIRCCFLPIDPDSVFHQDLPDPAAPLLSQHLQRLELHCSRVNLDFSGCPALRDLKMEHCITLAESLVAPALQYLSITSCELYMGHRTSISLPSLVRLELVENFGRLPLLDGLPSLEIATVRLGDFSGDRCFISDTGCHEAHGHPCSDCRFAFEFDASRRSSYFFQGLSKATHLEVSASYDHAFILQMDLKWRPTFPMLKTLVMDDWCLDSDLSALVLFIQQSPNLEKLTLKFFEEFDPSMVTEGTNHQLAWASTSYHLKMVEIKCQKVDARVDKVQKVLTSGDVPGAYKIISMSHRPCLKCEDSQLSLSFSICPVVLMLQLASLLVALCQTFVLILLDACIDVLLPICLGLSSIYSIMCSFNVCLTGPPAVSFKLAHSVLFKLESKWMHTNGVDLNGCICESSMHSVHVELCTYIPSLLTSYIY